MGLLDKCCLCAGMSTTREKEHVIVRPMSEEDAPVIAQIWRDGLKQTAESTHFVLRPVVSRFMEKYGEQAMLPDGHVGPDGKNLISNWIAKEDRIMFVALQHLKCVGCVGVKVGTDIEKQESSSVTVASIWRLSVDERVRRQGVGMALMCAAEDWARQQGCTSMCLESANKIAAKFYVDKAGYKEEPFPMDESLFHHYAGLVMKYKKSLVENGDRNQ